MITGNPEGVIEVDGGVCAPAGFLASGVACGIKKDGSKDLALLYSLYPADAAGVFTTNALEAAPVTLTRERLAGGRVRAVLVNSGIANAMTGSRGMHDAIETAGEAEQRLGLSPGEVLVASTGVIGEYLPMGLLVPGIQDAAGALDRLGHADAARAILTTDTRAKELALEMDAGCGKVRIGGMAKGSGMIHPDMATMLCFITTDADLDPGTIRAWLRQAVDESFNRLTVDGDQSTNDMVLMLANGAASPGGRELSRKEEEVFRQALCLLARRLAYEMARDGEGTTRVLNVAVRGARSNQDAFRVARAVASSSLVKCAMHGAMPSWGRVAAAAGSAGVKLDAGSVSIFFGSHRVAHCGVADEFDPEGVSALLASGHVDITVDLGSGTGVSSYLSTDITGEYVRFNSLKKS